MCQSLEKSCKNRRRVEVASGDWGSAPGPRVFFLIHSCNFTFYYYHIKKMRLISISSSTVLCCSINMLQLDDEQ